MIQGYTYLRIVKASHTWHIFCAHAATCGGDQDRLKRHCYLLSVKRELRCSLSLRQGKISDGFKSKLGSLNLAMRRTAFAIQQVNVFVFREQSIDQITYLLDDAVRMLSEHRLNCMEA